MAIPRPGCRLSRAQLPFQLVTRSRRGTHRAPAPATRVSTRSAMTPHNHVWVAKAGRWFSEVRSADRSSSSEKSHRGATICSPGHRRPDFSRLPAARAIEDVHHAKAACSHRRPSACGRSTASPRCRSHAGPWMARKRCSPDAQDDQRRWQRSFGRLLWPGGSPTAVGASDFHGIGLMGYSRTACLRAKPDRGGRARGHPGRKNRGLRSWSAAPGDDSDRVGEWRASARGSEPPAPWPRQIIQQGRYLGAHDRAAFSTSGSRAFSKL